ncbi:hypothetical protein QZH41_020058, partial [Actinostola sp. cb2023]
MEEEAESSHTGDDEDIGGLNCSSNTIEIEPDMQPAHEPKFIVFYSMLVSIL